jgi:hypothetical protein
VEADGSQDDAENSYYEEAADLGFRPRGESTAPVPAASISGA